MRMLVVLALVAVAVTVAGSAGADIVPCSKACGFGSLDACPPELCGGRSAGDVGIFATFAFDDSFVANDSEQIAKRLDSAGFPTLASRNSNGDIMSVMFLVMMETSNDARNDIKSQMAKLKSFEQKREATRDAVNTMKGLPTLVVHYCVGEFCGALGLA